VVFWFWHPDGDGELKVFGDFRILGSENNATAEGSLARGSRLIAGDEGARLTLGGYCELDLDSRSEVTIRGTPGSERIELHRGQVRAQIQPRRGKFVLLTPLGQIEVKGTESVTTLAYPDTSKGEHAMKAQASRVVVTVAVLAGTVVCHFGDGSTVLTQGMNRVFAGDKDDGQQGDKDDYQQGDKDDGQQGNKDDGQQGDKDDYQQGDKDDGQQGDKDDYQQGDKAPVLILTAKDTVQDPITGLRPGADDYLVKPFAFQELPVVSAHSCEDGIDRRRW